MTDGSRTSPKPIDWDKLTLIGKEKTVETRQRKGINSTFPIPSFFIVVSDRKVPWAGGQGGFGSLSRCSSRTLALGVVTQLWDKWGINPTWNSHSCALTVSEETQESPKIPLDQTSPFSPQLPPNLELLARKIFPKFQFLCPCSTSVTTTPAPNPLLVIP